MLGYSDIGIKVGMQILILKIDIVDRGCDPVNRLI